MEEPTNRYLRATEGIPRGETRSFLELAALAARCGAARAAARAVRECPPDASAPWHRIVAADGSLDRDPERAALQLRRLRREGARPRAGEAVPAWARRVGARQVGKLPERVFAPPRDPRVANWGPLAVEPLRERRAARRRGFAPIDEERVEAPPVPRGGARSGAPSRSRRPLEKRLAALDWDSIETDLATRGLHHRPGLLSAGECAALLREGAREERIERTVSMRPLGYGQGVYHYWKEPPPEPLAALRALLYLRLRPLAARLRSPRRPDEAPFPPTLAGFQRACRAAGQRRGSCILLRYGEGGVNHPHRDVYGKVWFPLQGLLVLSERGRDFRGGEFLLHEERGEGLVSRRVAVSEGDLVLFASAQRLERRAGRWRKVPLLHGMGPVTRGSRFAAGIVFHLAR